MGPSESFWISHYKLLLTAKSVSFIFQCIFYILSQLCERLWVGLLRWWHGSSLGFSLVLYPLGRDLPSLVSPRWVMLRGPAGHRGCLCPSTIPALEMLSQSSWQILQAQPRHEILIAITAISFPYVPASCKHLRKMRSILNSHQCRKMFILPVLHSSLALSLQIFFQVFFFFIYNLMLFIKKKKIFGNVSIRETQKISAKNTQ